MRVAYDYARQSNYDLYPQFHRGWDLVDRLPTDRPATRSLYDLATDAILAWQPGEGEAGQ